MEVWEEEWDLDLVEGFRFLCQEVLVVLVLEMVLSNLVNNPFSHNILDQEGDQVVVVVEEDQEVDHKARMGFPLNLIPQVQEVLDQG